MRLVICAAALLLTVQARAGEPLEALVLLVAQESPLSAATTAAAEVPSPTMSSPRLAALLGVVTLPSQQEVDELRRAFEGAVDHFYAGRDERSDEELTSFIAALDAAPQLFFVDPSLRQAGFSAFLHRAEAAWANRDDVLVDHHLREVVARFPGLVPEPRDFPPWLRERHQSATRSAAASAEVVLVSDEGCEVWVDGQVAGRGPRVVVGLAVGRHGARATCGGALGPVHVFEAEPARREVRLLSLHSTELSLGEPVPRLVPKAGSAGGAAMADAVLVGRAAGVSRFVVVLADQGEVRLVDATQAKVVRTVSFKDAAEMAAALPREPRLTLVEPEVSGQPWYKDPLAFSFVGVGAALFTVGLVLAQVYGRPSSTEPLAWSLLAGGVGSAVTGVVLFAVPNQESGRRTASAGVSLCMTF